MIRLHKCASSWTMNRKEIITCKQKKWQCNCHVSSKHILWTILAKLLKRLMIGLSWNVCLRPVDGVLAKYNLDRLKLRLTSAKLNDLLNNKQGKEIWCSRSVREGEPSHRYLFVLVLDRLHKMLEREREQGHSRGLGASGNITLSLISNLWLFGECIIGQAMPLKFILYRYTVASKMNIHKSSLIYFLHLVFLFIFFHSRNSEPHESSFLQLFNTMNGGIKPRM